MGVDKRVIAMRDDRQAATAPLEAFLPAYEEDDNWWWEISCGHHQNLFEAAVERLAEVDRLTAQRDAVLALCDEADTAKHPMPGQHWDVPTASIRRALGVTE